MGRPYNGEGAATSATIVSSTLSAPGLAASFNPLLLPTGSVMAPLPPHPALKPGVVGLGGMTTTTTASTTTAAVMQV